MLLLAMMGLVACQAASGSSAARVPPRPAATSSPAPAMPVGSPDAGPGAAAVPPLGPLAVRHHPDLLVHGDALDSATIGRVRGLVAPGASVTLRQGQVTLVLADGPHPIPAAGVDPGSFRAFAPEGTAEVTAVWDAAARGELVVSHEVADRLALPLGGTISVSGQGGAPIPLRIGAFADTGMAGVDAVVSAATSDRLGLPAEHSVILSGDGANLSALTKAAKLGLPAGVAVDLLDHAVLSGHAFMNGGDSAKAFGVLPYQQFPDGTVVPDPAWVTANIVRAKVPILGTVMCHRLMIPQLGGALHDIEQAGLADRIHADQYQGCYVPKLIEDSTSISMHTWGLAVDLNVPTNQRGTRGDMDPQVVAIFKAWGFRWGGDFHTVPDPMHFELIGLVRR
ncbi:MAG: hypothetical protein QOG64_391 [Acidimicrobiaceae bacterium]|nr:hypothetical protein [Acidimicrobiaceae bacterium]